MRLVISAVNLVEGGPLTVLRDVARAVSSEFPDIEVIALVNRIGLTGSPTVREIAFPEVKSSWLKRLWFEWFRCRKLSLQLQADVWLSLQDITPRVTAGRQYVYCQNPSPFSDVEIPYERLEWKFWMFRRFYGFLYGAFIHRNEAVIVQQEWLRECFVERYGVRRVIVAYPSSDSSALHPSSFRRSSTPQNFLYPAFPRVLKNFQVLGECALLLDREPSWSGTITLTIDGSENKYASLMRRCYGHSRTLRFIGLQSHTEMPALYEAADALIFPSLLETWGLPLTESKRFKLPVVVADRPYAREALGDHDNVVFFDPFDAVCLAELLLALHRGARSFETSRPPPPSTPFAANYGELLSLILDGRRQALES